MVKISIPAIPPSLNVTQRMHWTKRSKENKHWAQQIKYALLEADYREIKPMDKAHVTLTYYFKTKQRRDPDNYAGKMILDGLRKCNVLTDDSFNNVTIHPVAMHDKDNPRTEITVEEMA